MHVTFIRHAATDLTQAGRICGQLDAPLSSWGRIQAQCVAQRLADRPFDALYTSHLQRARDTAAAISETTGLQPVVDKRFSELFFGRFEGEPVRALAEDPSGFGHKWQKDPARKRFPGGENLRELAIRGWDGLDEVYAAHPDGHVLIVAHMFLISALLCRIAHVGVARYRLFCVDTCSLSTAHIREGGFRLMQLNDVAHLEKLDGKGGLKLHGALPGKYGAGGP